ncbi:MAG: MBL fold metallo-hydrolase [Saprospiraceae bacterium]|nr:MBL fold metallo-hydrolase [Saprospiraceae bacterium]
MKVEQIYTGCLAEAAYYIESDGEAAIIDPLRETEPYIERAQEDEAEIKYVLETHFHADFVSGHLELARKTGATIVYGPNAKPNFEAHVAEDGEELRLGKVTIKVLHTPGHTLESSTFLLKDEKGDEYAIFTGDTLFLGDVGRPDLAVKSDLTKEDLAAHLYDSLRNKIMPLPDDVIVYPGHGAGSACGKKMSKDTWGYLGDQKKTNYALQKEMTKEEFIEEVTSDLVDPPQYFPKNAEMNKQGYESLERVRQRGMNPLSVRAFKAAWAEEDALVLDTRHQDEFATGHIPNSVFIGIDDNFAPWVGALINDLQQPILFISEKGREEEVITRLARVGYHNPIGYLKGGFEAWKKAGEEVATVAEIEAEDLASLYKKKDINILDVRRYSEYDEQHVKGAQHFPLSFINKNMSEVDKDKKYYVHCGGGYRSMIACSILISRGYDDVVNVRGGFKAIKETDLPLTEYSEQATEL